MPPNHLAVNFNNKFQALGIVNAQKQAGKGKTVYPDLTSEGGGPPPLGVEEAATPEDRATAMMSQDTAAGSGHTGADLSIRDRAQLPLSSRICSYTIRGAKKLQSSLIATLIVSGLVLAAILLLREIGWLAIHQNPSLEELELDTAQPTPK